MYANVAAPVEYEPVSKTSGQDGAVWNRTFSECMSGKGWYAVDENGDKTEYKYCNNPIGCF